MARLLMIFALFAVITTTFALPMPEEENVAVKAVVQREKRWVGEFINII